MRLSKRTLAVFSVSSLFLGAIISQPENVLANEEIKAPIASLSMDLSLAQKVSISPGRIAVLRLPEAIAEAKVGAPSHLKAVLSTTDQSEITLFWIAPMPHRTNLIIRTTKHVFVFEILPDLNRHQDYLKVRGAFGGPTNSKSAHESVIAQGVLVPQHRQSLKSKVVLEGKLQ